MNVLITGGAGALAAKLVPPLVGRGDRVVLGDIRPPRQHTQAEFIELDVTHPEGVQKAVRGHSVDSIFHLAAILSAQAEQDDELAWRVNMDGTRNVLEAARQCGVQRVVFSSTVATYGAPLPDPLPIDAPQWPMGLYGVTKMAAERLGVYYHHRFGLDFRAVRLAAVAGPGSAAGGASGYISGAFEQALRKGRYQFHVTPTTRAPVIYIADAVEALINLHDVASDRLSRRVYNVAGIGPSAEELAAVITARHPHAQITYQPDPLLVKIVGSWPVRIDDSDATRDWGWQSRYDLNRMADAFFQELQVAR